MLAGVKPSICLATPAPAANNGNGRTAQRWARWLAADYRVRVCQHWDHGDDALLLALHARRSATSVAEFAASYPQRPVVLVLTGTDLYDDLPVDASAQRSVELARRLVALHERAPLALPARWRERCDICFQSTSSLPAWPRTSQRLRAVMVGHLREVKSPRTLWAAAARLRGRRDIVIDHIGAPLDAELGAAAAACALAGSNYRWLGALSHGQTLRRIRAAHVLVHASRAEGGAHVVMEAVCRGTPVLASRIDGNVGMLGADYGGYFAPGDDAALAALLERARDDPAMLPALQAQCDRRAPLFAPERERATLRRIIHQALESSP